MNWVSKWSRDVREMLLRMWEKLYGGKSGAYLALNAFQKEAEDNSCSQVRESVHYMSFTAKD